MSVWPRQTDRHLSKIPSFSITRMVSSINSKWDSKHRDTMWQTTIYATGIDDHEQQKAWLNAYAQRPLPPGWKLNGQIELCPKTNRHHIQGHITTPQVRGSAVMKEFPKQHLEIVRDRTALTNYDGKLDTRVSAFQTPDAPSFWEFHEIVAEKWDDIKWSLISSGVTFEEMIAGKLDDYALKYVDQIVGELIEEGIRGAEFMGVNPMFRSAWKRFWKNITNRKKKILDANISNATPHEEALQSPPTPSPSDA